MGAQYIARAPVARESDQDGVKFHSGTIADEAAPE